MHATTYGMRTIDIGREQMLSIQGGRGDRVRVLCGSVLLTQEGDLEEAMLDPGREFELHAGRTLIEALQPARLQIVREGRRPRGPVAAVRRWRQRLQLGPVQGEPAI